jgi:hypothetical protein
MRRIGALAAAAACAIALAGAAHADQSNTGCGLGSILFEGQDGLLSQVCAATFNGSFGTQTFGITSGTANCERAAKFASNEQLNRFVGENMDNIAMDMSKGGGEYLATLAVLMDVPAEERSALYTRLQSNFSRIFTSETVTSVDVLNNIEAVLAAS